MIDFAALLYAPIYQAFGVPATFTCLYGDRVELTVIDQTSGVEVADASSIDVKTIRPAVTLRVGGSGCERDLTQPTSRTPGWCWEIGPGGSRRRCRNRRRLVKPRVSSTCS